MCFLGNCVRAETRPRAENLRGKDASTNDQCRIGAPAEPTTIPYQRMNYAAYHGASSQPLISANESRVFVRATGLGDYWYPK